jgi:hypothetical protein
MYRPILPPKRTGQRRGRLLPIGSMPLATVQVGRKERRQSTVTWTWPGGTSEKEGERSKALKFTLGTLRADFRSECQAPSHLLAGLVALNLWCWLAHQTWWSGLVWPTESARLSMRSTASRAARFNGITRLLDSFLLFVT